jgi:basic amino acid/polyamine antiporter, APA family
MLGTPMVNPPPEQLKRILALPLVVLYGLGITIGAGIYVLVGETAGRAGMLAPLSFFGAAVVMLFPALCFAELSGRYPFSSGAAQYVEESFGSQSVGRFIGILMISAGLVAASTISLGSVGFLNSFTSLPSWIVLVVVVASMGIICAWGIRESVIFASLMTLLEIGGLLAVIIGGFFSNPDLLSHIDRLIPVEWSSAVIISIIQASLLAFFAFIGFEGISNIAEETIEPRKTLPRAILLTLTISTVIYVLVVSVALLTVGPADLATQSAPLSHLFERTTGLPAAIITLIAVFATLNGVIVQIIMVSRLSYGLSSRGLLPAFLGIINERTRTPLTATILTVAAVLVMALVFPVITLAEWTSRLILFVFAIVCVALTKLKFTPAPPPPGTFEVNAIVPVIGAIGCAALLVVDLIWG